MTVFGELVVDEVTADAYQECRTARLIARQDTAPHYKLSMPIRGHCLVVQDGREALLGPTDLAIYDTQRPYAVVFEQACQMLTLTFPQRNLRLPPRAVAEITATTISGRHGVAALLSAILTDLVSRMDEVSTAQSLRLADNVIDLITTTFAGELNEEIAGQQSLLPRMKAFVEEHLDDADLSPAAIANWAHISTGYLHKLFRAENTTVSRWIRERRLEHCRRDLTDPSHFDQPVSAVAARWGFVDAAHFSRLFKTTYGVPPREYRILSELEA